MSPQAWLNKREVQEHDVLEPLFECIFDEVYTYVKQNLAPKMEVLECNVIKQVCAALHLAFGVLNSPVSIC